MLRAMSLCFSHLVEWRTLSIGIALDALFFINVFIVGELIGSRVGPICWDVCVSQEWRVRNEESTSRVSEYEFAWLHGSSVNATEWLYVWFCYLHVDVCCSNCDVVYIGYELCVFRKVCLRWGVYVEECGWKNAFNFELALCRCNIFL